MPMRFHGDQSPMTGEVMNRVVLLAASLAGVVVLGVLGWAVFARETAGTAYTMADAEAAFARTDYPRVVEILTELADEGNPTAQFRLGAMYRDGLGTAADLDRSLHYFELAQTTRFPGAADALIPIYVARAREAGEPEAEISWFQRAADLGDASSLAVLGSYYLSGVGVEADPQRAIDQYLIPAAEAGDVRAQTNLGFAYTRGVGVAPDEAEAFRWYLAAAEGGLVRAQAAVGLMYETGRGTDVNLGEALRWYLNAVDEGIEGVSSRLGNLVASGQIEARSDAEAARWVLAAAETGNADALGWLENRAESGMGDAMAGLANLYETGTGVPQNPARARGFYIDAANAGIASAQLWLAQRYAAGDGVEQSYEDAHFWANLAAAGGQDGAADQRNTVEQFLSAAEIEAAQERASTWLEARRREN